VEEYCTVLISGTLKKSAVSLPRKTKKQLVITTVSDEAQTGQVRSFRAGNNLLGVVKVVNIISVLLVTSLLLFLLLYFYYVTCFVRIHDLKKSFF
jgi:hypothetical protein